MVQLPSQYTIYQYVGSRMCNLVKKSDRPLLHDDLDLCYGITFSLL